MPSDLVQRLASHFGPYLAHDPALVSETTSICTHYNVAPEDLFYKWEAFAVNNSLPQSEPLTIDHARELRKIIASSINSGNSANTTHVLHSTPLKPSSALNRAKGIIGGDLGAMLGVKSTPIKTSTNYNNNNDNAFQTPIRNEANTSPFSAPGVTPATASAYKQPHSFSSTQRDMDTIMSDLDQSPLGPVSLATTASSCSSKPKVPRFTILESLNDHLDLICTGSQLASPLSSGAKKWSSSSSRVSLAMATDPKAWNYRYMFEPKSERSLVLDDRIEDFATIFRDAYSIEESEEFGDASLPSQEAIWVVGRICAALPAFHSCDGEVLRSKAVSRCLKVGGMNQDEESLKILGLPKLSETGVVLESSRMMGSGNRTRLSFDKGCHVKYTPQDVGTRGLATTLSLFPGQMVMLKGMNSGAEKFCVSHIYFPPPLPLAVHTVQEVLDHNYSPNKLDGKALNIVIASGPFTQDTNLEFNEWHRLMDQLESGGLPIYPNQDDHHDDDDDVDEKFLVSEKERRGVPDTLILIGPFIESNHPLLGFSNELVEEMFSRHFSSRIQKLIQNYPATQVVLIPSTLDFLNLHSAYPQPGFSKQDAFGRMKLPKGKVRCLPNPSVFYINEFVVGVTSADSLGDLKSEEMVTRIQASPTKNNNNNTLQQVVARQEEQLEKGRVGGGEGKQVDVESVASKNKETNTRWSRSILSQRCFYPVFPPPTSSLQSATLNYDTSHSHLLNFPAVTPDLLILPSNKLVKPFIRVVNSATVLQPGTLVNGSVAAIQIHPLPKLELQNLNSDQTINSRLYHRARIDIVAI